MHDSVFSFGKNKFISKWNITREKIAIAGQLFLHYGDLGLTGGIT